MAPSPIHSEQAIYFADGKRNRGLAVLVGVVRCHEMRIVVPLFEQPTIKASPGADLLLPEGFCIPFGAFLLLPLRRH
jgi:hypothetical protein